MEKKEKIKYGAAVYLGLKSLQQTTSDLASSFAENSQASLISFGTEQCSRIGSSIAAAYTLDQTLDSIEKTALPKPFRGLLATLISTVGVAAGVHYIGDNFGINIEENASLIDTTLDLFRIYGDSLKRLVTFNSDIHAGYLTGSLLVVKSAGRLVYNMITGIAESAENKEKKQKKN